jgi:hypothetical protein
MTTTAAVPRWCATCGSDVTFEQPECIDEHEGECPEWACVRCGEAFLVGFALPERRARPRPSTHVA